MDICWEIAKEIGKVPWAQVTYSLSLKENVENLKRKMEELKSLKNDVKTELRRGEIQVGKKRKREVNLWLKNVNRITKEVHSIEEELQERRWFLRSNLGMLVAKAIEEVIKLQEKHKLFNGLLLDLLQDTQMAFPAAALVGETTAKKTLEMIWDCLMNAEIRKIGVYGMGGVGKTAIMKHINNRLTETQYFEHVIWVTASKALNLKRLQAEIAKAIELEFSKDEDNDRRSKKIFAALMRRKRFVLILDDMWKSFPLEMIGIPEPCGENGCKLIFTTRDLSLCRNIESQRDIKVDLLSEDEAWELFEEKVGGEAVISPCMRDVAKCVSDECGRLPLTIVMVGRALRHQTDVRVWSDTLNELKHSALKIKCMEDDVFERLKISYDRLRSDQIRAYFLYCALYPKCFAIPTKELIDYWIWEGLIDEMGNREVEINRGHKILSELKYASMLEGGVDEYNVEYVKMHELVRDLAIDITRSRPRFMIKAGVELKESPQEQEWAEDAERISLMQNSIKMLSGQPNCSKLSTLLLQNNCVLQNIPQSFFEHMCSLKVLNLSHTNIESLPASVSDLGGLHALLLGSCWRLRSLPSLEKLKALRVLDLSSTLIEQLPQGMEQLVKLRRLDLSWTLKLRMLQAGVISNLPLLEDLELYGSGWRLTSNSIGADLKELTSLGRLVNLSLHFTDLRSFSSYVASRHWQQLKHFSLVVGPAPENSPRPLVCSIEIHDGDLTSQATSIVLPNNPRNLRITHLSELEGLLNLRELKECEIYKCYGMDCILMMKENTLPTLEKSVLWELPCSRTICKGFVPDGTFASLRSLDIEGCHDLKSLFSLGLLQKLSNLEVIKVQYCRHMEGLEAREEEMDEDDNNNDAITLPCLTAMCLIGLPELKSICKKAMVCTCLTTIVIRNCPQLEKLPFSANNLPPDQRGDIEGSREWWDSLDWDHHNTKILFQPLFKETEELELVSI
ncbi:disease resistance protein At4g27190-like [Magnolia sinica]|uniref:disease resistance protein At4g27190-like n=1 Tax=Magnolia sinica TaxID=86752 RepID=UPI00265A4C4A|nr:disease resistance protein At4g27190-like [Magnolia sinica]XP_058073197.1 disease resistance protein At4g27190-like [Magnolia sinica]XP_058073198.1 disease resistance protein At4g27190-like [Magnolia sinica]XP_058073199.1 disease resistance protein At4g27190-like [Magnolia sinica]XP_058073200.1 disease resistance protein At4g27190-like [Magnolia sinica]XP_058073201.1 disease resistance protein At4g27190-like [Magnolia sinica]XP_058073202.1 disease resistance protein At4g27190-like [Magnoli